MELIDIDRALSKLDEQLKSFRKDFYDFTKFSCYNKIDIITGKSLELAKEIKEGSSRIENAIISLSVLISNIKTKRKSNWFTGGIVINSTALLDLEQTFMVSYTDRNTYINEITRLLSEVSAKIQRLESAKEQAETMYLNICGTIGTIPDCLSDEFTVKSSLIYVNIDEDPIGSFEKLHKEIKIPLDLYKLQLSQHDQFIKNIENADKGLEVLDKSIEKMTLLINDCSAKISEITFRKIANDDVVRLKTWLNKIKETMVNNISSAQIGFKNWKKLFDQTFESVDSNMKIANEAIEKRETLRGRFSALIQKRIALKINPDISKNIEHDLKRMLFDQNVTPIIQAQTILTQYAGILAKEGQHK